MAITLIKENGSGLSDANCYADLDDLENQAELLGEDISSYSDEQKKSSLYIAAKKYIDRLNTFKGDKIDADQSMKIYTDKVTFDDASADIIGANVEAAILNLKGYLFIDPTTQDINGQIVSKSSGLDVLKKSVVYKSGTAKTTKYSTASIDQLLSPYMVNGGGIRCEVL